MRKVFPGILEKQTAVGKYLEPGLLFYFITSRSSKQRSDLSLAMYSPQSLHRWGITHSESMERLAYSQGTSANDIKSIIQNKTAAITVCKIIIL